MIPATYSYNCNNGYTYNPTSDLCEKTTKPTPSCPVGKTLSNDKCYHSECIKPPGVTFPPFSTQSKNIISDKNKHRADRIFKRKKLI
jgi:hypothetical protein